MSHRGVEIALGKLATDDAVRRQFQESPVLALRELMALGIELSAVELAALQSLDPSAIRLFAQALDARLQRAVLVAQTGGAAKANGDAGGGLRLSLEPDPTRG